MAIDVNGVEVIDNNQKGKFKGVNFGSTAPSSPSVGDVYYDSSAKTIKVYVSSSGGWK